MRRAKIETHIFFKIFFLYLKERQKEARAGEGAEAKAEGEGEADSSLSREPDMGLHPRTLRS